MSSKPPFTHFGFEKIPLEEKTPKVKTLFDRVASSYDLMNDLMSLGLHRLWKKELIDALPYPSAKLPSFTVLDVAGGTGDISARMLDKYASLSIPLQLILADLSEGMIQQGRQKEIFLNNQHMSWVCGNGESLPFSNETFDLCTLVFGLRNIANQEQALREVFRVLKPGGTFFCLEFSAVTSPLLSGLYDLYSFNIIPCLGHWVANDEKAYQYLVESIRRFPSQKLLADLMETLGFQNVTFQNFLSGVAAVHQGSKDASL